MTAPAPHVLTVGEAMGLITNDRPGALDASRTHALSFGGAESNVAIALARLGTRATWVSLLGDDPLGDLIVRELRAEGVTVHAPRHPERPTGLMHKHRRTTTMATVNFWRDGSAASRLAPGDVPSELLATANVVHLTGILAGLGPDSLDCAEQTALHARASGAALSFDINHRESVWRGREARAAYLRLATLADVVFAGEEEAALLVDEGTPIEMAQRLRELGPREVVIKRGARGAVAVDGHDQHDEQAMKIDVLDTVGAGDAFVAGYLSLWGRDASLADRLRRATTVGAFACMSTGDWEGSPTIEELARWGAAEGVQR
ncbi:sugar kinase [Microbacterium oxydans]|uniref:sugar kinase n=1 Tax=Microbacterium oxydans TaxID=82380 RepID=UPI0022B0FA4D|nr:sugar kinase [Microbacterium oxydans]MCZ4302500.1 sugar kinase [Microbacterium oxydans]